MCPASDQSSSVPSGIRWKPVVLIALLVCIAYISPALHAYGTIDDYGCWFWYRKGWLSWNYGGHTRDGRPLGAIAVWLGYAYLPSIATLWVLRAVALVSALGLALSIQRIGRLLRLDEPDTLAIIAAVVFLPAMGANIGWAIMFYYVPVVAGLIWFSYWVSRKCESSHGWQQTALWVLLSCLAGIIALLFYQPLAGVLLLIPFAQYCVSREGRGEKGLIVTILGVFLAFGAYKAVIYPNLHLIHEGWGSSARAAVELDLGHWTELLTHWLPYAISEWGELLFQSSPSRLLFSSVFGIWAIAGFVAAVTRVRGQELRRAVVILAALVMAAPQVFLLSDIWSYRVWYPLGVMFFFLQWLGISSLLQASKRMAAAVAVTLAAAALTAVCVHIGIVRNGVHEYSVIRTSLAEAGQSDPQAILCVVGSSGIASPEPTVIHRSGTFSQVAIDFWGEGVPQAIAADMWGLDRQKPLLLSTTPERLRTIPGIPVADAYTPFRGSFPAPSAVGNADGHASLPGLGEVETDGSWYRHPQLGYIHPALSGGYYSPVLGHLLVDQSSDGQWWLQSDRDGKAMIMATEPLRLATPEGREGHYELKDDQPELIWDANE